MSRFGLVLLACTAVVALLAVQVLTHGPVTQVDQAVTAWLASHRQPWLTRGMLWIAAAHQTAPLLAMTALVALWRGWRRDAAALRLLAVVPAGMLLNVGLKHLVQRPRPFSHEPLVHLVTYSFPSGHAAASTVFYGAMCGLVFMLARSRAVGSGSALVAGAMVLLVAFCRVYLGVHYLSDVVAGIAVGIACLAVARRAGVTRASSRG